jgi:quercetin dioxygenase-like cupin family protein
VAIDTRSGHPAFRAGAALAVPAGRGTREVWWIGGKVLIKLTAAESGGALGVWEFDAALGAATPVHVHRREDEHFVVVEGSARFLVGDQRIDAGPGDYVFLPRDVPHAYLITSERARVIGMVTPGGMEAFFTDVGAPVVAGEPQAPPPDRELMARTLTRYGNELLGPPPGLDA